MTPILEIDALSLRFAGVHALDGVSLSVARGELVAVIGPNGAGKTSLFNCISGTYLPTSGSVRLEDVDLIGRAPHQIASLGVGRMFQNLALFEHMTVLDNLMLGRHQLYQTRFFHDVLFSSRARAEEVQHRRRVEEIIEFLDLERWRMMPASILPYGVRKRVELGRALAMNPKLLLLDEPAAGLNREETEEMARFILDIKAELGITEIVIEHDLRLVMDVADRIIVLEFGRKIAEGAPREIAEHPDVVAAYVGVALTKTDDAA